MRSIIRAFEIYSDDERVLQAFPSLRLARVDAAMRFYEANRELLRTYIGENGAAFKWTRPVRARPA